MISGGIRDLNITFLRDFNDWEIDDVVAFYRFLHSKTPPREEPDGFRWKLRKHGVFESRSFYHALRGPLEVHFPWKGIWRVKAPKRVFFFVWTAAWDTILTCDNLMHRGYAMAG